MYSGLQINQRFQSQEYVEYCNDNLKPSDLRKFIAYLQELVETDESANFIYNTCEWRIASNTETSSIRILDKNFEGSERETFDNFIDTLKNDLGFILKRNNVSNKVLVQYCNEKTKEQRQDFIANHELSTKNPIISLEELTKLPGWTEASRDSVPFIYYYVPYKEAINNALNVPVAKQGYAISWLYIACLHQHTDLLRMYDTAFGDCVAPLESKIKKTIAASLISSLEDSVAIHSLVKKQNSDFLQTVKDSSLIKDLLPYMNDFQKEQFYSNDGASKVQKWKF